MNTSQKPTVWVLIATWVADPGQHSDVSVQVFSTAEKAWASMEACIVENYDTGMTDTGEVEALAAEAIAAVRADFTEDSGVEWVDGSGDYALELRPKVMDSEF